MNLLESFEEADRAFLAETTDLLNVGRYAEVLRLVRGRLKQVQHASDEQKQLLRLELVGLLLDAGSEGKDESAVREALELLEKDRSASGRLVKEYSYEFNLGNAEAALFDILQSRPGFRLRPSTTEGLVRAKNHYWRAYRLMPGKHAQGRLELLVNLGNALKDSGRVAEALDCYGEVLGQDPQFPEAHLNRGRCLVRLHELCGILSASLLYSALVEFSAAADSTRLPATFRDFASGQRDAVRAWLAQVGYTEELAAREAAEALNEAAGHTEFRKFCLGQQLALSEHSLFCSCAAAKADDLAMAGDRAGVRGSVPMLASLLDRIESEFCLARRLYYEYMHDATAYKMEPEQTVLSNFFEREHPSVQVEKLRTSFRLCFGILDKIALGVCDLFQLANREEKVYFESFWKPTGKSSEQRQRWDRLNRLENQGLVALYSQATDLASDHGEWHGYKVWRNALEHRLFLLVDDDPQSPDQEQIVGGHPVVRESESNFHERTRHLLRLTRSAIMYFVWCVRAEIGNEAHGSGRTAPVGT